MAKRLNIMLYSNSTKEQIILPINPENIELKYEKKIETYNILGFGEINIQSERKPVKVKLSHFLPEDDSVFNTNSGIMYQTEENENFIEYNYSSNRAVEMFKKWSLEKNLIRLVIDDELNIEGFVVLFSQTIRESTTSKPYMLEIIENRSPFIKADNELGLYSRKTSVSIPKTIVMKAKDTVYSIAYKYGLDFKKLAENNGIKDVNKEMAGFKLSTIGA